MNQSGVKVFRRRSPIKDSMPALSPAAFPVYRAAIVLPTTWTLDRIPRFQDGRLAAETVDFLAEEALATPSGSPIRFGLKFTVSPADRRCKGCATPSSAARPAIHLSSKSPLA